LPLNVLNKHGIWLIGFLNRTIIRNYLRKKKKKHI